MNPGTVAGKEKQMNTDERLDGEVYVEGKVSGDGTDFSVQNVTDPTKARGVEHSSVETKSVSEGDTISVLTTYKDVEDIESIPKYVQEQSATLSFPEKLMLMLAHVEKECAKSGTHVDEACIGWILDGRAFIIRNKQVLVDTALPLIFRKAKFPSFTRKLYRWGFRQVSISAERVGQRQELIFGHENFQRNNRQLLAKMRSVTAAGTRRAIAALAMKQQSAANRLGVIATSSSTGAEISPTPANPSIKGILELGDSSLQQQSLTLIAQQAVNRLGPFGNPMINGAMAAAMVAAQQQQQQQHGPSLFNSTIGFSSQGQPAISQQYLATLSALALSNLRPEGNEATTATSETGVPSADRLHAAVDLLLRFASP